MRAFNRLLKAVFVSVAGFAAVLSLASDRPPFLTPVDGNGFAEVRPGIYAARFNAARMRAMEAGDEAQFVLPGVANETLVLDRLIDHPNGDYTWIGHVKNHGRDYRVTVTKAAGAAIGEVRTPASRYLIDASDHITSTSEANLKSHQTCGGERKARPGDRPLAAEANGFAGDNVVDLMVLYTPSLPTIAGVSAESAINHLVALTNQSYIDSGINLQMRVVHTQSVNYTERNLNDTALDDLTASSGVFSGVPALRAAKGADLVTLVRPLDSDTHDSCGVAWLNGAEGEPMDNETAVYSVVSYGTNKGLICDSYTLAHELGHSMGSAHDFLHSRSQGAYPYSYGYGQQGIFGTIMSYLDPIVGRFSSPLKECVSGRLCGNSGADNARSLNNTAPVVAAFMPSTSSPALTGITVTPASIAIGGTATIQPVPDGASTGACTSSNSTVATVSGSRVTGLAAGNATIQCGSVTAPVSVGNSPSQQVFSLSATKSVNSAGSVALSVTLKPNAADTGKTANIYVAAQVLWNGSPRWFVFNGTNWLDSAQAGFPAAYRMTLSETISGLQAFNYEISELTLRSLRADIYVGYEPDGGSDLAPLVYGIAQSFR